MASGLLVSPWAAPQEPAAVAHEVRVPFRSGIAVDGDLGEWAGQSPSLELNGLDNVFEPATRGGWGGPDDISAQIHLAYDRAHLYVAGTVADDSLLPRRDGQFWHQADTIEVFLDLDLEDDASEFNADDFQIYLMPLNDERPWGVMDYLGVGEGAARPGGSTLTGFRVVGRILDAGTYQFEAAIPFHQLSALRPGTGVIGFNLALNDHDREKPGRYVYMTWNGRNPVGKPQNMGRLVFDGPGPMTSEPETTAFLGRQFLADLPYVLVPLAGIIALALLLRIWSAARRRLPVLRPIVQVVGVLLFGVGMFVPSWWMEARHRDQEAALNDSVAALEVALPRLEQGTLASYGGASRDDALISLLEGRAIARQKYTAYRPLAALVDADFGVSRRKFPDEYFRVRPYWIPLELGRAEQFHFDPPLHGEAVYVVVGRPAQSVTYPFPQQNFEVAAVQVDVPPREPGGEPEVHELVFAEGFASGATLGRDGSEVAFATLPLQGEVRTLSLAALAGQDLHLVGITLLTRQGEEADPLFLGQASLGGVQTDLRGAFPDGAGLELGPGARVTVDVPEGRAEPCQKLWLFYRGIYPGVPAGNPGAKVAEVTVHFAADHPPRTIALEHQTSMLYELAKHNVLDEPPPSSPAEVAFAWVDADQERHINIAYPVVDLPAGAVVRALEFRNVGNYRIQFRSVVLGAEKAAAPQDPVDSPLVREGQDRRLRGETLAQLDDVSIAIFRGGRLSESTLPEAQRSDFSTLPQDWQSASPRVVESGVVRRLESYRPLLGDGWDGAVLGVYHTDTLNRSATERSSMLGLILCLLASPILLILFSEMLAALNSLRVRLIAVLTVAALVPLSVLSVVLVQVLERGHEADLQDGIRQQAASAVQQLEDQKVRLADSSRQWLGDLVQVYEATVPDPPETMPPDSFEEKLLSLLQLQMSSQLPPEWGGGFMRLQFLPDPENMALEPHETSAGDPALAGAQTPARLEPGIDIYWGTVLITVRSEEQVRGGMLSLTVGRPIGEDLLGILNPGRAALLTDARGYPLSAVGGGGVDGQMVLAHALRPAVMAERERHKLEVLDTGQPVVDSTQAGDLAWRMGYEVLRDLQGTPRAMLVLVQPEQRATLDLAVGRVPVRAFFALVAGLLIVLSVFLSFVVGSRISRPIEQLERGAQAISRGELDARVQTEEGGQIGRLTRSFNRMAQDLQGRIHDLNLLNRGIRELTAQLDVHQTLDVVRRFCEQHSPADKVRIALVDPEARHVELHGGEHVQVFDHGAADLAAVLTADGPFCSVLVPADDGEPGLSADVPGSQSLLGVPLLLADHSMGAILLLFENAHPLPVNLDLLSTLAAQAAVAVENARLYRLAVQDPHTGAFMPDFFRGRVAEEVRRAQERGQPLALLGVWLGDGQREPRGLDRVAAGLSECLPEGAVLCHAGGGTFQVLVPGAPRPEAEALMGMLLEACHRAAAELPVAEQSDRQPMGALVVFPDEAASAEFLFDALQDRLAAGQPVDMAVAELAESLQREGVSAASPAMRDVFRILRRVAPTDLTLLLEGETGTGKEVVTNLIHRWSKRSAGPLVKVHCAALSENLLQSELFGHEKGAFTGADRRKIGKFEQAQGGTIFLDEVGEISLDVQVKLLRVLQEREIDRVGGTDPVPVDVRVIAATNRDIRSMVAAGTFREDLYYRLQGMVLLVPPLRERKQDIPALVEHFRGEVVRAGQSQVRGFSTDAMDELFRRDWPGNVRELRNVVFRAMVLATREQVELADLVGVLPPPTPAEQAASGAPEPVVVVPQPPAPPPAEPANVLPALPPVALEGRLRFLYDLIAERGTIRTSDYVQSRGVSPRTGLRDLQTLVERGVVERIGKRRGARYRLSSRTDR